MIRIGVAGHRPEKLGETFPAPDSTSTSKEKSITTAQRNELLGSLRQRIQQRMRATTQETAPRIAYTPPRYDAVFAEGQQWIDALAGDPVADSSGTLIIDDSIWKSPGRYDPDLP